MDESLISRRPMSPDAHQDEGLLAEPPAKDIAKRVGKLKISPKIKRDKKLEKLLEEDDSFHTEMDLVEEMQREKARYPGAEGWASDEERLFEILFMRQSLPMLPSNWAIDLQRVAISSVTFETTDENPPIIYAHGKQFAATVTLTRLIDLTPNVRSKIQTGLEHKAPRLIKTTLKKYINWAAKDGGYDTLRIVPNILVETINTGLSKDEITKQLTTRMRDFGRLQREFLREDRDPTFWSVIKPSLLHPKKVKPEPRDDDDEIPTKIMLAPRRESLPSPFRLGPDEVAADTGTVNTVRIKVEPGLKRRRPFSSLESADADELTEEGEVRGKKRRRVSESPSPSNRKAKSRKVDPYQWDQPTTSRQLSPCRRKSNFSSNIRYRRTPPVIYGMFIVRNSVLVMTIDSSQGDDAYVTFHVPVDMDDAHQSVWNALTIAAVVCLARDELRTRLDDFEPLPVYVDSDPDA